MHGTGPNYNNFNYFRVDQQTVWPGQLITSYIGIYVKSVAEEGTYELVMDPSPLYDFQWEGLDWNVPNVRVVINDSAERCDLWVEGQDYYPENNLEEVYQTYLFTKQLTLRFHNPELAPDTIPNPKVLYISNEGNGGPIIPGPLPSPFETAEPLNFAGNVAIVTDTVSLADPLYDRWGNSVHCKVYSFEVEANSSYQFQMTNDGGWPAYLTVSYVKGTVNKTEQMMNDNNNNPNPSFGAYYTDAGTYYVIPQGQNFEDVGSFTLTVTKL